MNNIRQFEALFNFATIGIVVTNHEGEIVNFNKYAETQFGYTKEEILGKVVDILLPTAAHHRHVKYREQYHLNPEPRIMGHGRDLFAKSKDGHTFPVEVSLSHYKIDQEVFVIAFVIDITIRKEQEAKEITQTQELQKITQEVKSMNQELEQKVEDRTKMLREALSELEKSKEELNVAFEKEKELNELKSGFVTIASHEFRTPLSTILSSAYLLEQYSASNPDERSEKHIHRIKESVAGMKNILEDFLSVGKLEEGLMQTNMEVISAASFEKLLNTMLQDLDGLLQNNQQIIIKNTVTEAVYADMNLVKHIVTNLISNAIKFSSEDITVTAICENKEAIITVADKGIGIAEEDQPLLFTRFFRARNATNIQGTGLGLHIIAKYLELMNGTISIESKIDEGTTVRISIPQRSTTTV